jgi:F0F1-type ATP synthase delta subunit
MAANRQDLPQVDSATTPDYGPETPAVQISGKACRIETELKSMQKRIKSDMTRIAKAMTEYKDLANELSNLECFKENKSDLIDAALSKTLKFAMRNDLLESAVQNADLRSISGMYDKLYNSSRLERNLSTNNQAVQVTFTDVSLKKDP